MTATEVILVAWVALNGLCLLVVRSPARYWALDLVDSINAAFQRGADPPRAELTVEGVHRERMAQWDKDFKRTLSIALHGCDCGGGSRTYEIGGEMKTWHECTNLYETYWDDIKCDCGARLYGKTPGGATYWTSHDCKKEEK